MSKRGDSESIRDIREAVRRIDIYLERLEYDEFIQDIKSQDAVVRNLEVIGEAAKNISNGLKKKHPEVPWKELAGLRDRLIHQYFGINFDIVFQIAKEELAPINLKIEKIVPGKNRK
ncbi:MAG: DUF86 domain-containing protein [Proteobacteria bacterium]|nr:DUF86 domain-containing protein [Pseudomonadota bacterium]